MPGNLEHKTDFYQSRRMAVEEVRESAEKLKADFMEQMEVKLSAVINDVVHSMQKAETAERYKNLASPTTTFPSSTFPSSLSSSSPSSTSTGAVTTTTTEDDGSSSTNHLQNLNTTTPTSASSHGHRSSRKLSLSGKLPEKVFISRPSPLTELLQVTHFKTIHHIFVATLILIMLHNIILDLVERNTVDLGLLRLMWAFGQPQMTLGILLTLEFCGLVVLYPAFHFWSRARHRVKPEWRKLVDYAAALSFTLFLTGMICIPAQIMWNNPLPPASGATVTMEQCRLLMKIYAFVRSNVPRVLLSSNSNSIKGNNRFSKRNGNTSPENSGIVVKKQQEEEQLEERDEVDEREILSKVSLSRITPKRKSPPTAEEEEENNGGNQEEKVLDNFKDDINGTWTSEGTAITKSTADCTAISEEKGIRRRRNGERNEEDGGDGGDCDNARTASTSGSTGERLMSLSSSYGGGVGGNCDNNGFGVGGVVGGTCPSFSKYLYFYVAPTLIYKDNYPRTSYVRWDYVCWNFAQVFGCIVYANFILSRYSTSYFINFGHPDHPMTVLQFCNAVFSMMLPGILGLVLGFYLLLHSWHNAFAEMLCFGDRLFYKDWWNCSSFHSYYKTWNILVHDWLYTYIFKDAWEFGLAKYNKALPTILVFVISSLFHEYVLSFTFNFFFPVLLTLFGGFGLALTFVRNSDSAIGNIFMWSGLIAGSGILVSTYTMEFYARINCPAGHEDATADFFTPRFWTCNALIWK